MVHEHRELTGKHRHDDAADKTDAGEQCECHAENFIRFALAVLCIRHADKARNGDRCAGRCQNTEKYKNVIRRVEMPHALIIEEIRKWNREKYIDEFDDKRRCRQNCGTL